MKNKKRLSLLLLLLISMSSAHADDYAKDAFNPVVTAVVSQTIAPEARGGSMGDIGVATEPDVNSQAWNPAKYPFCISKGGVAINYTPWLRQLVNDIDLGYLAGYYRIGDYQALSGSLRFFSLGEVSSNDITAHPYEMAVDVAYSRMLSEKLSAAIALRYIYSNIDGNVSNDLHAGSAYAADIAMYYNNYIMLGNRESMLGFGLNISNIGSKINFGEDYSYFIPTTLRLGVGLTVPLNEYNKLAFNVEASKLLVPSKPLKKIIDGEEEDDEEYNERIRKEYYEISSISGIFKSFHDSPNGFKGEMQEILWGVGAEYTYNDRFSLRAGYHHESESQGNRKYFTFGAGFKMSIFSIDAGYVVSASSSNPLDQTIRVSLGFDMDGIKDLFGRRR